MKRIKSLNIMFILLMIISVFSILTPVNAATATVGFSGDSTVSVGSNITIKMYVNSDSSTNGGIVSVGGNLSFDSNYLEYVSGTGTNSPYKFQINTSANYIIAGLDTTLDSGITSKTEVFTFVFKAKKVGNTQITLTNAKLSDVSSKLTTNVSPKTITIIDNEPTPTPTPSPSPSPSPSPTPSPSPSTKSSDATLKSLSASGYNLSPSFSKDNTSYTVKVPKTATTVKLEGTANDSKAKVSGLGNITLTGDTTTATIKITAEDGTTKTYTVKIEKEKEATTTKSSDATLKKLDIGGFTLNPTFKSNINTYSIKVKNNITGLDVTAIPNNDKAKVTISGNKNWKEGTNTVTIKVTAEDGSVNNYIINVERESSNSNKNNQTTKSSDNYLKSLTITSSHEIKPSFNKNVTSYNITVPYEVDKLNLNAIPNDSKSKVEITGNENFKVGKVNTVEIKVTAEDGSVRLYSLNVTRSTTSSKTDLKDIIIDNADLSPKFDPNNQEYTTKVDGKTDKLDIKADPADSSSKVEVIGNENLKEGHNTVLIKVTDKDGFIKYYSIDVEKAKKESKILGLSPVQFGIITGIISLLLLWILLLLFRKKKDDDNNPSTKEPKPVTPIIEVKPEFNFGSKNSSDDDVIHGNYNQNSELSTSDSDIKSLDTPKTYDADYEENIPYDPYDETVTKREIIDAIHEATKTKDPSKLKMLLQQDALNQKKKELKRKEEEQRKYQDNDDEWR
ncbi:MAG: cadherin-like beta sandwich domain-containing protein [Tenericutes bacterium]|nr:cadherin-like beta sandwich domain-containing protein [Mycoplasmatota bacterium]